MKLFSLFSFWQRTPRYAESTPDDSIVRFILFHNNLRIGTLSSNGEQWTFQYSSAFRKQKNLRPLIEFPDLDKTYRTDDLWPFFELRIPSLHQPSVANAIAREQIDPTDEAALLKRFGRRTITNPFELVAS